MPEKVAVAASAVAWQDARVFRQATWVLWAVLAGSGCIRSSSDVPAPGEGGFVSGLVVGRDIATTERVGLVDVNVRALGVSASVATDDRGFFQLTRLPLDTVTLQIVRRGAPGIPEVGRVLPPVRVLVDGQQIDLGEIQLLGDGALDGQVLRQADLDSVPVGVGGAVIALAQTSFSAISETDGRFRVTRLPQGTFDVVVFAAGHLPAVVPGVAIAPGTQTTLRPVVLRPGVPEPVAVRGAAFKQDDLEHAGIAVQWIAQGSGEIAASSSTDPDGEYAVDVQPGVYRVRFTADGYRPADVPSVAVLPTGVIGLVNGYLSPGIAGDFDGDGVADAEDLDRDGDGCPDAVDAAPEDAGLCLDSDGDGVADALDPDDDNDGLSDGEELSTGVDGVLTDPLDSDTDDDGAADGDDNCPVISNPDQNDENGNGLGDACEVRSAVPRIFDFAPTEGAGGTTVVIRGDAFVPDPRQNLVGFNGGFATPTAATATQLSVDVPLTARTGPITVFSGPQSVTSSVTFTFLAPPRVVDFDPLAVRPGDLVAVFGEDFGEAPVITVDGRATTSEVCPDAVGNTAAGRGLDVACFRPVLMTPSGPVGVTSERGFGQSVAALTILEGVQIVRFSVNPVSPGAETAILGSGFSVAPGLPDPRVLFSGATDATTPRSFSDTAINVVVPSDAITGPVTVIHPAGEVISSVSLQIENALPAVIDIQPNPARVGDTLRISGVNLGDVVQVTYAGGAVSAVTATAAEVATVVPANVEAGPIRLTFGDGTADLTPSRRLAVVEVIETFVSGLDNLVPGTVWLADDRFLALTSQDIVIFDSALTAATTSPRPTSNVVRSIQGSPSGTRMIAFESQGTQSPLVIYSVPDLRRIGICESALGSSNVIVWSPNGRYGYATRSPDVAGQALVWVIDTETGQCSTIGVRPGRITGALAVEWPNVVMSTATSGQIAGLAKVNVDPNDSILDGTYVTDFGVLNSTSFFQDQMMLYLGSPTRVFMMTTNTLAAVSAFPTNGGNMPILFNLRGTSRATQSADTRWLLRRSASGNAQLEDLQQERTIRADLPSFDALTATVRPIGAGFVYRTGNTANFVQVNVRE